MLKLNSEFVVAGIPIHSYLCYSHILRSLQPDVITTVRDLNRTVMPDTPPGCIRLSEAGTAIWLHLHLGFHTSSCVGPAYQQPACRSFSPPGTLHILKFWKEDPVGWFHYAEAEFVVAGIPIHSYLCYSHVLRSLQPDVITTVRDLVRTVTLGTPGAYAYLKQALLSRYTSTAIGSCFRFHRPSRFE